MLATFKFYKHLVSLEFKPFKKRKKLCIYYHPILLLQSPPTLYHPPFKQLSSKDFRVLDFTSIEPVWVAEQRIKIF